MSPTEAERRAVKKYHDKQAGMTIRVSHSQREHVQRAAQDAGQSIKAFILEAIDERMERLKGDKTE